MHVMEYCCIIVTHVLRCVFNNIALFHCRDAVCRVAFPYFNIGVNAAKFAQIEGSISNKLMKIITMIFGSHIAGACRGDTLKVKL